MRDTRIVYYLRSFATDDWETMFPRLCKRSGMTLARIMFCGVHPRCPNTPPLGIYPDPAKLHGLLASDKKLVLGVTTERFTSM
jgi:hypothetical protein